MTPNGVGLIEWVAKGGSAVGLTTDGASYAIGSTTIGLGVGATGKISAGQSIYFQGDNHKYVVMNNIPDVSLGGTITLVTGLQQAIPAMATPIYTGGELKRGWGHTALYSPTGVVAGTTSPTWRDWYEAGEVAQLWFDKGYSVFDHKHKDFIIRSQSMTNIVQTQVFGELEKWTIGMDFIYDISLPGYRSDIKAIESYVDAWLSGIQIVWFPDYTSRPELHYWTILESRSEPRRIDNLNMYSIEFMLVKEHQFSYTIPTFI